MNSPNPNLNSIILKEVKDDIRQNVHQIRIRHRSTVLDAQRNGINECTTTNEEEQQRIYTESDIIGISSRIKRRRQADRVDLESLSNAFIQDEQFCTKFINIPGALQVLIKELINTSESDKKLLAIECICNLTGGNDFVCEKVAIASTFYLMSNLTSLDETIRTMSVFALANLTKCLDGEKTLKILESYRIVPKLLALIKRDTDKMDSEFNTIVLDIILRLMKIVENIYSEDGLLAYHYFCGLKQQTPKTIKIIYLIYTTTNFGFVNTYEKNKGIIDSILIFLKDDNKSNLISGFDLTISIRMLANLISTGENATETFISWFQERSFEQIYISTIFGKYLSHKEISVRKETLWLLGNIYCSKYPFVQRYLTELDNFVNTLNAADELLSIFIQPSQMVTSNVMDMDDNSL